MTSDLRAEALSRLYHAVFLLASEIGSIEERLARAYFLYLAAVHTPALPHEARERFERIRAELEALYPAPGTVNGLHLHRDTAVNLAQSLLLLYDDLNP